MGGVLGVTAYGRTQEKVAGATNVSTGLPTSGVATPTLSSTTPAFNGGGFSSPTPTSFSQPAPSYGGGYNPGASTDYSQQPISVTVGFGGKSAPPAAPQPYI
jgi:hypothetical protein